MLASIHPLGERARNTSFLVTALAYIIGSTAGGLAMGTALGGLGGLALPDLTARTMGVIAALIAASGAILDLSSARVPAWQRQVNEDWLTTYRGWVYGVGFGFQLGMGLVTIVTSASVYGTFLLAFVSGTWHTGALIGAVFGFARSAVIFSIANVTTPAALRSRHRSMQDRSALAQRVAVGSQALVFVAAVGAIAWL